MRHRLNPGGLRAQMCVKGPVKAPCQRPERTACRTPGNPRASRPSALVSKMPLSWQSVWRRRATDNPALAVRAMHSLLSSTQTPPTCCLPGPFSPSYPAPPHCHQLRQPTQGATANMDSQSSHVAAVTPTASALSLLIVRPCERRQAPVLCPYLACCGDHGEKNTAGTTPATPRALSPQTCHPRNGDSSSVSTYPYCAPIPASLICFTALRPKYVPRSGPRNVHYPPNL